MAFTQEEIIYYLVVWAVGSFCGLFRILRDREYLDFWSCLGRSVSAGILSFGIVGIWVGRNPDHASGPMYYLALAALLGYLSEEQEQIAKWMLRSSLKKLGITTEDPPAQDTPDQDTQPPAQDPQA